MLTSLVSVNRGRTRQLFESLSETLRGPSDHLVEIDGETSFEAKQILSLVLLLQCMELIQVFFERLFLLVMGPLFPKVSPCALLMRLFDVLCGLFHLESWLGRLEFCGSVFGEVLVFFELSLKLEQNALFPIIIPTLPQVPTLIPAALNFTELQDPFRFPEADIHHLVVIAPGPHVILGEVQLAFGKLLEIDLTRVTNVSQRRWKMVHHLESMFMRLVKWQARSV